jgi:hypothetical protein
MQSVPITTDVVSLNQALEMWIPETTDEEVLKIVQLTLVSLNLDFRCFIVKVFGLVYGV